MTFTYNRLGQRKTVTDAVGTRTFGYNAQLQLDTEDLDGNGTYAAAVITRKYETSGTQLGKDKGFTIDLDDNGTLDYAVTYVHGTTSGLLTVIQSEGLGLSPGALYFRTANSDLIDTVYYRKTATNKLAINRSYESNRDLITSIDNDIDANGTYVSKYNYDEISSAGGYDALGRRTSVVYTGTAFTAVSSEHHVDWDYNDRSELTDANRKTGTTPGSGSATGSPHTWDYAYDAIGNRLTFELDADGTPTAYDANDLNQYEDTTNPTEDFDYDEDGNLDVDGNYDYTWDCENRLISVAPASSPVSGDRKLEFAYDYMGRRVRKTAWTHNGSTWVEDSDLRFVYDDWNPVLVLDDDNVILRKYTWGLDLSGQQGAAGFSPRGLANGTSAAFGIHGAGGIGGLLAAQETQGTATIDDDAWYWFTYDANGNVGQVLEYDAQTSTVLTTPAAHYEYDPYGNLINDISSQAYGPDNPFRFSTKWHDTDLPGNTLVYYGGRYYLPKRGRWLNRDPIEEQGGPNVYSFVLNHPTGRVDPLGLMPPGVLPPFPAPDGCYWVPGFGYVCPEPNESRTPLGCALKIADEVRARWGRRSDGYQHCVAACRAGATCGLRPLVLLGGFLRECRGEWRHPKANDFWSDNNDNRRGVNHSVVCGLKDGRQAQKKCCEDLCEPKPPVTLPPGIHPPGSPFCTEEGCIIGI